MSKTLYKTLLLCVMASFILVVGIYAVVSSNPVTSRLGFALFVSTVPALVVLAVFKLTRMRCSVLRTVLAYAAALIALQVLLEVVR